MRSSAKVRLPRCGKQASRPRAMSWEREDSRDVRSSASSAVTGRCWITPEAVTSVSQPLRSRKEKPARFGVRDRIHAGGAARGRHMRTAPLAHSRSDGGRPTVEMTDSVSGVVPPPAGECLPVAAADSRARTRRLDAKRDRATLDRHSVRGCRGSAKAARGSDGGTGGPARRDGRGSPQPQ
jgi:hypothetical protein